MTCGRSCKDGRCRRGFLRRRAHPLDRNLCDDGGGPGAAAAGRSRLSHASGLSARGGAALARIACAELAATGPERADGLVGKGMRALASGDRRYGTDPDDGQLIAPSSSLDTTWSQPLKHGAIEIAIVGDVERGRAIALVAGTFGALPMREARRHRNSNTTCPLRLPGGQLAPCSPTRARPTRRWRMSSGR